MAKPVDVAGKQTGSARQELSLKKQHPKIGKHCCRATMESRFSEYSCDTNTIPNLNIGIQNIIWPLPYTTNINWIFLFTLTAERKYKEGTLTLFGFSPLNTGKIIWKTKGLSTLTGGTKRSDRCINGRFSGSSEDPLNRPQITLPLNPVLYWNKKSKGTRWESVSHQHRVVWTPRCKSFYAPPIISVPEVICQL
ncbi:hypothetical protein UY3_13934 [Chelonia mydas]|uniref:Uncharacterized protein n=1 Tax=Chelonia mydas TaxID=8469 RepID=M7AU24_CHEMY|nr:hypothetical protein UY3_13934 [Chelonia mydas]